jgi:hypothetical protein
MAVHQCCKSSTLASLGRCRNTEDAHPARARVAERLFRETLLRQAEAAAAWLFAPKSDHAGHRSPSAIGVGVVAAERTERGATRSRRSMPRQAAGLRWHRGLLCHARMQVQTRRGQVSGSPMVSSRAGRAAGSTIRRQRQQVDLCRHEEIVLVQSLDLPGAQRHRRIAPAETYGFCDLSDLLHERQGFPEVSKPESSLDPGGRAGIEIRRKPFTCCPVTLGDRGIGKHFVADLVNARLIATGPRGSGVARAGLQDSFSSDGLVWVPSAGSLLGDSPASLAVAGIPTASLGSSLLLMICNIERPPWRCPRKPPNLSHCQREIVSGDGGGGRYEYTRGNFGEVLRSRYRRC